MVRRGDLKLNKKGKVETEKKKVKWYVTVILIIASILIFGSAGFFGFIFYMESQDKLTPSDQVLNKLRSLPSNKEGLTVDKYLNQFVRESREAGRLVEPKGWTYKNLDGNRTMLIFRFEETGNKIIEASWLADMNNNTFEPKTDLAKDVYSKK